MPPFCPGPPISTWCTCTADLACARRLAGRHTAAELARNWDDLAVEAQPRAPHATVHKNLLQDPFRSIDGHRKAQRLRASDDRRVDPHHFSRRIEQGAAAVAWVQGYGRLDDIFDHVARNALDASPQRGDHASGHRVGET